MRERISTDTKSALKAGDRAKVATLRLISAAIQSADIEAETKDRAKLTDADLVGVLSRMVKQRRDSIDQFTKGGRGDLAAKEEAEIAVIEAYLPRQMGEAEVKAAVATAIKETGAAGAKDMGRVMATLKQRHAGGMDFAKASAIAKELLK